MTCPGPPEGLTRQGQLLHQLRSLLIGEGGWELVVAIPWVQMDGSAFEVGDEVYVDVTNVLNGAEAPNFS